VSELVYKTGNGTAWTGDAADTLREICGDESIDLIEPSAGTMRLTEAKRFAKRDEESRSTDVELCAGSISPSRVRSQGRDKGTAETVPEPRPAESPA
jgi:hypothetical protein